MLLAAAGVGACALHKHSADETAQDMKDMCQALRGAAAAVITNNSNTAPIWFTMVQVDAQGMGGQVEQDEQMLGQASMRTT